MGEEGLSIGQVSAQTGLSVHTLRFYEREGILVASIRRDGGGRRVYTAEDVEWLSLCVNLRTTGMPIPQIRRYTELVRAGAGNEKERLEVLREHRQRMLAQLGDLRRCVELIEYKVSVYEATVAMPASMEVPIRGDKASDEGAVVGRRRRGRAPPHESADVVRIAKALEAPGVRFWVDGGA